MIALQDSAPATVEARPGDSSDKAKIIVERAHPAKRKPLVLLCVLALALVTFFFGLGELALVGPDEPRYAEVAREMYATGDYVSTRLCGCLWFEKPVLLYWLAAASYHLFGVSEFAARFPSALAALVAVAMIFYCLRRAVSTEAAIASSIVLATSGIFIAYARVATPDMLLASTMSISLLSGYLAISSTGRSRAVFWILSFAGMGLAMLAKGLAGIALTAGILVPYIAITRRWKVIGWKVLITGLFAFTFVFATWYLPVTLKHGWQFIEEFFIRHHFERYTSNLYGHPQPFYFFLFVAIAGVTPWTFFLIPAIARLKRLKPRENKTDSILVFLWVWAALPLVFFSLSASKLPGYVLMIFPALAAIIGFEVDRYWKGERDKKLTAAAWLTLIFLLGLAVGFIVYSAGKQAPFTGLNALFYMLPLVFAATGGIMLFRARKKRFIAAAAAVVASIVVSAAAMLFPALSYELSFKSLSLEAAAALRPNEKIAFFILKEFTPVFYAEGRVVCGFDSPSVLNALKQDVLADALRQEKSLIVITHSRWEDDLIEDQRFNVEFIAKQRDGLAFRVTLK